jgi:hypothetical protein
MEPVLGGKRHSGSPLEGARDAHNWSRGRLDGPEAKRGTQLKAETVVRPVIPSGKESERLAAASMHKALGLYCKEWAPPGADFEYKYKRSDALNRLAVVEIQAEADALWREIHNTNSAILIGPLLDEDVLAALEEAIEGPGQIRLASLLEAPKEAGA